jgi:hypothetical protein
MGITPNVLIFPSDDRCGQASLLWFYNMIGCNVLLPKFGHAGIDWLKKATWPSLLCKSTEDPTKRNIEIYGFERDENKCFGEDLFLKYEEIPKELYADNITCQLVDLEKDKTPIHILHTLRGANLQECFEFARAYCPTAKWVSSTISHYNWCEQNIPIDNACKFIPANYSDQAIGKKNNVNIIAPPFYFDLLNVDRTNSVERTNFASFHHNFAVREKEGFEMFTKVNEILKEKNLEIINYGGNVRGMGSDITKTEKNGITGNFKTLSPREALKLIKTLSAVAIFKQFDWGGGVVYDCLNSFTPIVTHKNYIKNSNSTLFLKSADSNWDPNCLAASTAEEFANSIINSNVKNEFGKDEFYYFSRSMQKTYNEIHNGKQLENFYEFIDKVLQG